MGHPFEAISGRIIEAAISVHRELGPGFLETAYDNALHVALRNRGIPFESQQEVTIWFEQETVGTHRLDLLVDGQIIVELKAVKDLEDIHFGQLLSYLKASGRKVGLLFNFGATSLVIKRVVA